MPCRHPGVRPVAGGIGATPSVDLRRRFRRFAGGAGRFGERVLRNPHRCGTRLVGRYEYEVWPPIEEMDREIVHSLVRTHPGSGRRHLFVNRSTFLRFVGWTEVESAVRHDFLLDHATRPEFTCRFRWSQDAVAIRDNRYTQPYAIDENRAGGRVMHGTSVEGDCPA